MPERITVRLDDALYGRLSVAAQARGTDVSSVVRQAVLAHLDGIDRTPLTAPPAHDREACAQAILATCPVEVQDALWARLTPVGLPLAHVLRLLVTVAVAPFADHAQQQGVQLSTVLHQALVLFVEGDEGQPRDRLSTTALSPPRRWCWSSARQ